MELFNLSFQQYNVHMWLSCNLCNQQNKHLNINHNIVTCLLHNKYDPVTLVTSSMGRCNHYETCEKVGKVVLTHLVTMAPTVDYCPI